MSRSPRPTRPHEHHDERSRIAGPEPAGREETVTARPVVGGLAHPVQRKVMVGAAHDPAELEAERVASEVVSVLRRTDTAAGDQPGAEAAAEVEGHQHGPCGCTPVRRQAAGTLGLAGGELDVDTESALRSGGGGGVGLEPQLRGRLEGALGADLSAVRLHAGSRAESLNRSMSAEAFTHGRDIYFRQGLPDTRTDSGLHLLAHELTHTVQQGTSPVAPVRRMTKKGKKENSPITDLKTLNAVIKDLGIKGGSVSLEDHLDGAEAAAVDQAIADSNLMIDASTTHKSIVSSIKTGLDNPKKKEVQSPEEVRKQAAKKTLVYEKQYYGGAVDELHVHVIGGGIHIKLGPDDRKNIYQNNKLYADQLKMARDELKKKPSYAHLNAALDKALLEYKQPLDTY